MTLAVFYKLFGIFGRMVIKKIKNKNRKSHEILGVVEIDGTIWIEEQFLD